MKRVACVLGDRRSSHRAVRATLRETTYALSSASNVLKEAKGAAGCIHASHGDSPTPPWGDATVFVSYDSLDAGWQVSRSRCQLLPVVWVVRSELMQRATALARSLPIVVLDAGELSSLALERAAAVAADRTQRHAAEKRYAAVTKAVSIELSGLEDERAIVARAVELAIARTSASLAVLCVEIETPKGVVYVCSGHGSGPVEIPSELAHHALFRPSNAETCIEQVLPSSVPESLAAAVGTLNARLVAPVPLRERASVSALVLFSDDTVPFSPDDELVADAIASSVAMGLRASTAIRARDRAIEVREDVLAVVSHDLRSPLSAIGLALELVAEDPSKETVMATVPRARRSLDRARRLLADLVDYGAIDSGGLRIDRRPTDPVALAESAIEEARAEAERNDLELHLLAPEDPPQIFADDRRLLQALSNLLQNAIRHTPPDGSVSVEVTITPATCVFCVADSGPGIAEEEQAQLFERYYQGRGTTRGGAGLGLAIARGIAEAHGGILTVESSVGDGARFLLSVISHSIEDEPMKGASLAAVAHA